MSTVRHTLFILSAVALLSACSKSEPTPEPQYDPELTAACDYIRGAGIGTTGGEGGDVYYVTRTDDVLDSNKKPAQGTLRYGVEELSNRRMILFRVAGTIHLTKPLTVRSGNITIAGQSAPGDGICIADYPLVIKASNVIVRYIRVRLGDVSKQEFDAISVNDADRVVLDHLSCSWSTDECVSVYGNTNFTMQYCFITESLHNSVHDKGAHGYGGIWGGRNVSFHHNLLAHHDSRNPRFDHDYVSTIVGPVDFINNVVYNWGSNSAYGGESTQSSGNTRKYNFVNNYYKAGPITLSHCSSKRRNQFLNPTTSCSSCGGTIIPGLFYMNGNVMFGDNNVTTNNWLGVHPDTDTDAMRNRCKASSPFSFTNSYTTYESAEEAFESVLAKGGCSFRRDVIDTRIVREVRTGTAECKGSVTDYNREKSYLSINGIIDTPKDAGGYPDLNAGTPVVDTDRDGMPDEWELLHDLDPTNPKDGNLRTLAKGHTNLEAYLCELVKDYYVK